MLARQESRGSDTRLQAERVDPEVGIIRILIDLPGVILGTKETGILPRPGEGPFDKIVRQ
jgi:hypothetical protein